MARPLKISNENILAVARSHFLEEGMNASTLAIAEQAGISEASIFKRFGTKQALFIAAMGVQEKPTWIQILANQTPSANVKEELTEICEQMLMFYQEIMPRVLMMMAQGTLPEPPTAMPPPIRDRKLMARFLDRAIEAGHLPPCDTQIVAQMIVGTLINTVVTQHMIRKLSVQTPLSPSVPQTTEVFIQSLIETLWCGIGAQP